MAYVVVHEICHLLIGPKHSDSGIFGGSWNIADMTKMRTLYLGFNKRDSKALLRSALAGSHYTKAQVTPPTSDSQYLAEH
ncbi:MAG: hypothetical protein U0Q18_11440 [Bryobacteraceae bacterium]